MLLDCWDQIGQATINMWRDQLPERLEIVIRAQSEHAEVRLSLSLSLSLFLSPF